MNDQSQGPTIIRQAFPAGRIAASLGITKRAVLSALKRVPPAHQVAVQGGIADAWTLDQLPADYRERLADTARRLGYRDAEAFLAEPVKRWEPEDGVSDLAQHCVESAVKLREALRPSLERLSSGQMKPGEVQALGLEDYARAFGHRVSDRHWRDLVKRACDRDRGFEEWGRLELYLPDRLCRKSGTASAPTAGGAGFSFPTVEAALDTVGDPANPKREEEALVMLRGFEALDGFGPDREPAKRALLGLVLARLPAIAPNAAALRRDFNRKQSAWIASGRQPAVLLDRRATANRKRCKVISQRDRDAIVGVSTLFTGGRVEQAIRKALHQGRLTDELAERVNNHPGSVQAIVQNVRPEVELLSDRHHGPRQSRLNGAHITRDWSGVFAGDWYTSDDLTLPVYYWIDDGNGWYELTRGQFLPLCDVRSKRILDFILIDSKSYTAASIRTLITKACDRFGLPRRGFYFERGIWKSSRLLKGAAEGCPTWSETEMGLRSLGLEFHHAQLARGKTVENTLGLFQNLMEGEPGYVGRCEMKEVFERVKASIWDVSARRLNPSDAGFRSAEQWFERLHELAAEYNAKPQDSIMTMGYSPDEAWEKFQNRNDPMVKLTPACRYLLATHMRPVTVGKNGVAFTFGGIKLVYSNEETGRLVGRSVLAWFDPECIDTVTLTDMNRQNPICVERRPAIPAMDATAEDLASAQAAVARQNRFAKVRYSELRAKFMPATRRNLVDRETAELGRAIDGGKTRVRARKTQAEQEEARVGRIVRDIGLPVPPGRAAAVATVATEDLEHLRAFLHPAPKADATGDTL